MSKTDYDMIIIGGGSGGLTAAVGAAGIGAKTLLIEKELLGGDCTHHGCVPSKTLIKAARVARQITNHKEYGLYSKIPVKPLFDLKKVLQKVQKTVGSIADHETPEEMKKYGIDVIIGSPKFVDKDTVEVNGKKITSKRFIISTGSRPRVPDIKGLDKVKYMTNKTIFDPTTYSSLAILGGGPIGSELGHALSTLGVKVTIINNAETIMGREDREAALLLEGIMIEEGVTIHNYSEITEVQQKGKKVKLTLRHQKSGKIENLTVDNLLLAVGRVPNIEGLGLEEAGIEYNKRGIDINAKGQTSQGHIYAVGDVAGGMQFTHMANHHAKMALSSLIFRIPAKYETEVIPRVTFTTPEVASVGITEKQAEEQGLDYTVIKKELKDVDRAITESETRGFYKFVLDKKGKILGSVLVGENSGELIGEVALAMKQGISIGQLAATIHPYPTFGYGLRHTADLFRAQGYTENKKKWVKRIFGLRGN